LSITTGTARLGVARSHPAAATRRAAALSWQATAVPAVLSTAATTVLACQELGKPSPWRDEAVTLGVSTRSFAQILHGATHVDAVLTPYYLAMHLLLGGRPDIFLARVPSLVATALTAGLLAVLAARLFGLRAAYLAGALYTVVPMTSRYAQEARPYAITALLAVGASIVLLRALDTNRWTWFGVYTMAITLMVYANLIAILLLAAHAVTVVTFRRHGRFFRWLGCAAVTVVAAVPLIWFGSHETFALQNLRRPGFVELASDLDGMSGNWQAFWWLAAVGAAGVVVMVVDRVRRTPSARAAYRRIASAHPIGWSVALPWVLLPPVLLFTISQFRPVYADRYLVFCLPAFVLAIAGAVARLPWPVPAALLVVVACLTVRVQHNIRSEAGHTEDLRNLSRFEIGQAHPGDALLYLPARLRVIQGAYPAMTAEVDDVALAQSPAASGTLYGTEIPAADVNAAVAAHRRVWVVTSVRAPVTSATDAAKLPALAKNYHLAWRHVYSGRFVLELFKHN
jgi:mannosyltransferase